ncbi:MAG: type II toxin-antitoxin system RelE/ParE family toxin [Actinomycetota bacterium]
MAGRSADPPQGEVDAVIDRLGEKGEHLEFPYQSQLDGKLRELRIQFGREKDRVSYYPAKRRRMVLLTVFRKQQRREKAEIERAKRAMAAHEESDK